MNCLSGYIGLKGCSTAAPGSGLYINSLPGLPPELFDGIANADQNTALNVWADIQTTSQQQLATDVSTAFASRYKIRSIARQLDLGRLIGTGTAIPATKYRGFELDPQNEACSGKVRSNLMGISCDELYLYLSGVITSDLAVKIYSSLGAELFSYLITPTAAVIGWNTIPVNVVFPNEKLSFVYDSTEVTPKLLTVTESTTTQWCNILCQSGCCSENCMGTVQGIESSDLSGISSVTYGTDTFGLTASISLVCSYERIVCQNKKSFARALWYLEGHHALFHALYTPEFVRANTVIREQTEQLKSEYFQRYVEELSRVVNGINLDTSDICLSCNQTYRKGWMT